MDLRMPRVDGIEAIRVLAERGERPRTIALTTYADDASVLGALRAGARGYLTKDAGAEEIRAAVEAVARGEAAPPPALPPPLVAAPGRPAPGRPPPPGGGPRPGAPPRPGGAGRSGGGRAARRGRRRRAGAARRPHPARGGGARADRGRAHERGDRGPARRERRNGQEPRQPHLRQGGRARPRAGGRVRLRARAGRTGRVGVGGGGAGCAPPRGGCSVAAGLRRPPGGDDVPRGAEGGEALALGAGPLAPVDGVCVERV